MHEHAKTCTPADQSLRNFKDGLSILMNIELSLHFRIVISRYVYSCTSLERGFHRVVLAVFGHDSSEAAHTAVNFT